MTYCKVSQIKPGELKFEGDGFTLKMTYSPQVVTPEIQFISITDNMLKQYWPKGVTRVIFKNIGKGTNRKAEFYLQQNYIIGNIREKLESTFADSSEAVKRWECLTIMKRKCLLILYLKF